MAKVIAEILEWQAHFTRDSGITVTVDNAHDWVSIDESAGESVFLQGEDGFDFIQKARKYFEESREIDMQTAYEAVAYNYLELLAE